MKTETIFIHRKKSQKHCNKATSAKKTNAKKIRIKRETKIKREILSKVFCLLEPIHYSTLQQERLLNVGWKRKSELLLPPQNE